MLEFDAPTIHQIHSKGSRGVVGYILKRLSEENDRIVAAYADVGTRFGLSKSMGARDIQVSIAEQSLIGVISGLYHEGFIPFGVAYAPFIVMRAADQIRMSVGAAGLGIKIVGGSAGLVSGNLGAASMALDDIAMMRAIPNMVVVSPADCLEAAKALQAASMTEKPVYIRLTGGNAVNAVYCTDYDFQLGKANIVRSEGDDVVIYATGTMVGHALLAADKLKKKGIGCVVVDMHTIKPIDEAAIKRFSHVPLAVSVEEHNTKGGLGSAIAECICAYSDQRLLRIGTDDCYPMADGYPALLKRCGLMPEQIYERIICELP